MFIDIVTELKYCDVIATSQKRHRQNVTYRKQFYCKQ